MKEVSDEMIYTIIKIEKEVSISIKNKYVSLTRAVV